MQAHWSPSQVGRLHLLLRTTSAFVVGSHLDATRVTHQLLKHHHAGYRPAGVAFTDGGPAVPATFELEQEAA